MSDRFEARKAATKEKIQQTFIELLHEKVFDDITVREISERAGIGFKTFYRHYDDKIELTQAILTQFVEELSTVVIPPTSLDATEQNARTMLLYVREHARVIYALGRTPAREELIQPVVEFALAEALQVQVTTLGGDSDADRQRREMVAHHFVHSQLGLFRWWVENDLILSEDEMMHLISELIIRPIWSLK